MIENRYRVSAKPPAPPDPYLLAWDTLRRRRLTVWAFVLLFPVVGFAASSLAHAWMFVLGPYAAALFVSSWMASYFECPHCGRTFAKKYAWAGDFRESFLRRCVHCGIAIGTPRSSVEDARGSEASQPAARVEASPSFAGEPSPDSERAEASPEERSKAI